MPVQNVQHVLLLNYRCIVGCTVDPDTHIFPKNDELTDLASRPLTVFISCCLCAILKPFTAVLCKCSEHVTFATFSLHAP